MFVIIKLRALILWRYTYSIQKACVNITMFISKHVYLSLTHWHHRHQIIFSYAENYMDLKNKYILFSSVLQLVPKNFEVEQCK